MDYRKRFFTTFKFHIYVVYFFCEFFLFFLYFFCKFLFLVFYFFQFLTNIWMFFDNIVNLFLKIFQRYSKSKIMRLNSESTIILLNHEIIINSFFFRPQDNSSFVFLTFFLYLFFQGL